MKLRNSIGIRWLRAVPRAMKTAFVGIVFVLTAHMLASKPAPHVPKGIVSDWTQRHVLYPDSQDQSVIARFRKDPRWEQNWYLRHREAWWPEYHPESSLPDGDSEREWLREHHREPGLPGEETRRDWSVNLGAPSSSTVIDFSFTINVTETAYGSVNVSDQGGGKWLATSGSLTVTGGSDVGTWTLIPGGPGMVNSPLGAFRYDNLITPAANPVLDTGGLLFGITGKELNVWGTGANTYSFYDYTSGVGYGTQLNSVNGTFTFQTAPGGGQSFPSKFNYDVTAAPDCTKDFVAIGIVATPASGGQANIVGLNNLYSTSPASAAPNCTTNGPTFVFAYASGTGDVPAPVAISLKGTQLGYIENLTTGKSYFHVLTIGTTGPNGTSATTAVVPGVGGNNAVDKTLLLSPDGGVTNQSSTSAPFILYTDNDAADIAFVTTYSSSGAGSGHLYKISNVFNGSATPTIVWSVAINAIPSAPIYDTLSNSIYFTDSKGRIDYVADIGSPPSVTYGPIVAGGTTSLNPVVVDNTNRYIYATFNTNGTNALVVQAPTTLASSVSVAVGAGNTTYTGPYDVEFNNAWYTGGAGPLMYVVGTGAGGTSPTLYSVGFGAMGVMNGTVTGTTALTSAAGADASPLTENYNTSLLKDYLFVGVTNHCRATNNGGNAGCVMRLDITGGFPTVNATTVALAAAGGTSGIVIDNDNTTLTQASSIYYATKTGNTLVKATQAALQ
jgi:hypothetical protein